MAGYMALSKLVLALAIGFMIQFAKPADAAPNWTLQIVAATPPDLPKVTDPEDSPILQMALRPLTGALRKVDRDYGLPEGFTVQVRYLGIEGFGRAQRIRWPGGAPALAMVPKGADAAPGLIIDLSASRMLGDLLAARQGKTRLRPEPLFAPDPTCVRQMLAAFRETVRSSSGPVDAQDLGPAVACLPTAYRARFAHLLAPMPRGFRGGMDQALERRVTECFAALESPRQAFFEGLLVKIVETQQVSAQDSAALNRRYLGAVNLSEKARNRCF